MLKWFLFILLIFNLYFTYSQDDVQKNGWHYYATGNYQKSIKLLNEEKKYYPNRINVYVIMGWDYRELNQYELMESISLEGLTIKPTDIRIIKNLSEAYYFQGKYQKAIENFEKYLKYHYQRNDPYLSQIFLYLGYAYLKIESYYKADIALSTSNYYKSNNYLTNLLLGDTNEKLKKFTKANEYYKIVLKLSPDNQKAIDAMKRIKDKLNG